MHRLGLDDEVADGEHVSVADQRAAAAPLRAERLDAARVRLDLRLHADHRGERVLGAILRKSAGRSDQQCREKETHAARNCTQAGEKTRAEFTPATGKPSKDRYASLRTLRHT